MRHGEDSGKSPNPYEFSIRRNVTAARYIAIRFMGKLLTPSKIEGYGSDAVDR